MAFRSAGLLLLTLCVLQLSACASHEPLAPLASAMQPDKPGNVSIIDRAEAWGGAVYAEAEGSVFGVALHGTDELGVWRVDSARTASRVADGLATGYHPDGVAVWAPGYFAVAVEGDRRLQLWSVAGSTVTKVSDLASPIAARDILVADLDADGAMDVVLAPYGGESLVLLWGRGGFEFDAPQELPGGRSPWHPKLYDLDGDGLPDLVWAELDTGMVRWARNRGGREFEVLDLRRVEGFTPRAVAVGDVNRNGLPDIVVAVEVGPSEVLLGREDGGFDVRNVPAPVLGYVSVAVFEDGTIAFGDEGQVVLAQLDSRGDWSYRRLEARSMPAPLLLADVDGDGFEDLIVMHSAGGGVKIHFGPVWDAAEPFVFND